MKKNLTQRVIIILVVTLVSIWIVIGPRRFPPRASDFTLAGLQKTLSENINLGLDLRGGSHLVMQVQASDYFKNITENLSVGVRNAAASAGFPVREVTPEVAGDEYRIVVTLSDPSKLNEVRDELPKRTSDFDPEVWSMVSATGDRIVWEMNDTAKPRLANQAVEQALTIIDNRLNALGVTEPNLQRHGSPSSNQILLQMPGIDDPQRIKTLLVGESKLELVKVVSPQGTLQRFPTEQAAIQSLGGTVPQNRRVLPYTERDDTATTNGQGEQAEKPTEWVIVETPAAVEGSELRDARSEQGDQGPDNYQIGFNLKPRGAEKFGQFTAQNINNWLGVVLDDKVKSIATIQSQISDSGRITGTFSKQAADDLALTLRSGALPAKLVYQEERTVGPSLGADSIRSGVTASLAGLIFVILFMVFYYRGAGINAVVALLLNLILTVAALIIFDAVLTLPGIAGLILTIGMAVDSNVLIFERIREEWRTGKTVASSVDQGFARAFATIIDTHVTTIVAAVFLFVFGTGPIRGFAVTLVLGLIANLFSAVFVSRSIFIWVLNRRGRRAESLSI
ncbi:MAG TPA: protein translocase subunit SecD [Pyrinomonadaceae bacterium]|nr:protein translocase subunit SecD [Pyrinomonadaceae bacterium]